jgi:hypothetical protein
VLSLTLFRDVWLTYFRGGSGLISHIAWHGGLG